MSEGNGPAETPDDIAAAHAGIEKRFALEAERQAILASIAAARPTTVTERVAWVLNNYPDTRNSDIGLMLQYWTLFTSYAGGSISPDDLSSVDT